MYDGISAAGVGVFDLVGVLENSGDQRVLEVNHGIDVPANAPRGPLRIQKIGVDEGEPVFSQEEVVGAELEGLGFLSQIVPELGDGFATEEIDAFAVFFADGEGFFEQLADLISHGCCIEVDFLKNLPLDLLTEDTVGIELVFTFLIVDRGFADDTGFGNRRFPFLMESKVFCDRSGTALVPGDEHFARHLDERTVFHSADAMLSALSDPF